MHLKRPLPPGVTAAIINFCVRFYSSLPVGKNALKRVIQAAEIIAFTGFYFCTVDTGARGREGEEEEEEGEKGRERATYLLQ